MIPNPTALAAIKTKLADPKYDGATAAEAADIMNTMLSQSPKVYASVPIPKGKFTMLIAPALLALPNASTEVQAKWKPIIDYILGSPGDPIDLAFISTMLSGAVADGLMTQDQVTAIASIGSKEVLVSDANTLGFAYLDADDIQAAMDS